MNSREKLEKFIEEAKVIAEKYGLSAVMSAYTLDGKNNLLSGGDCFFTNDIEESPFTLITGCMTALTEAFMQSSHKLNVPDDISFSTILTKILESHTKTVVGMLGNEENCSSNQKSSGQQSASQQKKKNNDAEEIADEFLKMINNYNNQNKEDK